MLGFRQSPHYSITPIFHYSNSSLERLDQRLADSVNVPCAQRQTMSPGLSSPIRRDDLVFVGINSTSICPLRLIA